MQPKPRVFIGSSVEGLSIAEHIQLGLDHHAECTLWSQGVFGLSGGTLESLLKAAKEYDFAVLVLTPDDLVQKRSVSRNSPRDNVLFELGLFMGALGRERAYIVYCRDMPIDLPTDLAGVTAATFAKRADGNLHAGLGAVCTQLKNAMVVHQMRHEGAPGPGDEGTAKLLAEVSLLRADFATQRDSINRMMESIMSGPALGNAGATGQSLRSRVDTLDFLLGVWTYPELGSTYYVRRQGGELRCVYCRGGNDMPTGEYYDWRLIDGILFARFRWFEQKSSMYGYVYLHVESNDRLAGGWLHQDEVPAEHIDELPRIAGGGPVIWVRQDGTTKIPDWVETAFEKVQGIEKRIVATRKPIPGKRLADG